MKCCIPEISWHNREPVLSLDLQPTNGNNNFYRLATGGNDAVVLIWKVQNREEGRIEVSVLCELTQHQKSVNVVKWSSNGQFLASADDDANIILWKLKSDNIPSLDEHENAFEERWIVYKILRGHKEDVYDLCWSPKCDKLLSGSVDNTAIVWDVNKGNNEQIITDHKGFVQGVAWDPKSDFIATLCSDRVCRIFDKSGRRVISRIGRGMLPVSETNELYSKEVKYFHDDTFKSYFRRLSFSPDGNLLLVPSGAVESEEKKNIIYGTFVFTMDSFSRPVCVLPSGKQCSIVVKCSPILYELRENGPKPNIDLPYRMVIAVATDSDVILYDTQQLAPCVHLQNIHYTRLTDLAWSPDGLLLGASSTDGFITLVTFEEGELGTPYILKEIVEDVNMSINGCEESLKIDAVMSEAVEVEKDKEKPKKPSFLVQWAKQAPKRKNDDQAKDAEKAKKVRSDEVATVENSKESDVDVEMKSVITVENNPKNDTTIIKKKRITPMLISKETSKSIVSKAKTTASSEVVSEESKEIVKNDTQDITRIKSDLNKEEDTKTEKSNEEVIEEASDKDVTAMPAPVTPKNKGMLGKTIAEPEKKAFVSPVSSSKPSTPNNPAPKDKSSSKKKKTTTPSNTLLRYLKPIIKTPSSSTESPKNEFKPQKLFGTEETTSKDVQMKQTDIETPKRELKVVLNPIDISTFLPSDSATNKSAIKKIATINSESATEVVKVKTANLFKRKSEASKHPSPKLKENEDTLTDLPEDFVLQVEDSPLQVDKLEKENDSKEKESKEIKELVVEKPLNNVKQCDVTINTKKRVPLITLSSPKNKKKPTN